MSQHPTSRAARRGLVILPLAGLVALAGCASSGGTGDAGDSAGNVEFSYTYATSNNLESPHEALANAYMEAHPEVTINLEPQPNDTYGDTVRTQLQAGNAPDVLEVEAGSGQTRSAIPLAEAGFLEPLAEASTDLIPEGSEALFQVDGQTFAQPLVLQMAGFIYNQTTAEGAGVTAFPETWDEMVQLCTQMTEQGKTAMLLGGGVAPNAGMTAMNLSATRVYAEDPDWNEQRMNDETTFADSEGWRATLQTLVDLKDSGCFQPGAEGAGFDVLTTGITTGQGLGFFGPIASATELRQAVPDQNIIAEVFPPATSSDEPFALVSPTYSLGVNAASDNKEAAQAFLAWVAEPEQAGLFAEISGGLPITGTQGVDLSDSPYAEVTDLLDSGSFVALPNQTWPNASVYEALATGVQGLLTGQNSVDDVLSQLDAAWDQ